MGGSVRPGSCSFPPRFWPHGTLRIGLPVHAYALSPKPILTRIETRSRPGLPLLEARLLAGCLAESNKKLAVSLDPFLLADGSVPCTAREKRRRLGPTDTAAR